MDNQTLEALDTDIWVVENDLFLMGIHFPGRMTVIRLGTGELWLHSPIPISDALAESLKALGPVGYIVAPNLFHHTYLEAASDRYPEAKVYGPPGIAQKQKNVSFAGTFDEGFPEVWKADLQMVHLPGVPTFSEAVFFHGASRTLITTDLFMNVHEARGVFSRFVYWAEGCWKRPAVPVLIRWLVKDRDRMKSDLQTVAGWPTERLVMAHGQIVRENAGAVLRDGLSSLGLKSALIASPT